jgi:hypothetical protein
LVTFVVCKKHVAHDEIFALVNDTFLTESFTYSKTDTILDKELERKKVVVTYRQLFCKFLIKKCPETLLQKSGFQKEIEAPAVRARSNECWILHKEPFLNVRLDITAAVVIQLQCSDM